MKKLLVSLLLAGVMVTAFGFVSTANAQGPVDQPFYGQGGGRGAARGGLGVANVDRDVNEDVHNLMMEAWSAELGLSVEELESRVENGERLAPGCPSRISARSRPQSTLRWRNRRSQPVTSTRRSTTG